MATFPIYNFSFNQGATFEMVFIYTDELEVPVNLTGYIARMQLRENITSVTPTINLTTENGGITITPLEGKLTVNMTATQTEAIKSRGYVYDIEIESADGKVYRIVEGSATCRPEATRPEGL